MAEIIISMTEVNHYSDDVLYDLHKFDYKCSLANLDINDVIYIDLMWAGKKGKGEACKTECSPLLLIYILKESKNERCSNYFSTIS